MPYDGMVIFKVNELLKYYTPVGFLLHGLLGGHK